MQKPPQYSLEFSVVLGLEIEIVRPRRPSVSDLINQANRLLIRATVSLRMNAVVGGVSRETEDRVFIAS